MLHGDKVPKAEQRIVIEQITNILKNIMTSKIPKKRGQLALEEQEYIRENFGKLTVEQIAEHLNRNTSPIKKYRTSRHTRY